MSKEDLGFAKCVVFLHRFWSNIGICIFSTSDGFKTASWVFYYWAN